VQKNRRIADRRPWGMQADGMWEHDQDVGQLLKLLDDLKIAEDTI
jgi:hypothetical protein